MEDNLKDKTLSGLVWGFAQKVLNQSLSFFVTVILARLLLPDDYGAVALASMFNVLMGIFIDGGMGMSLIQKKDADDLDYNTVFHSGMVMSVIIFTFVFFAAPYLADVYHNPLLCPLTRVLALSMPLGAISNVQFSIISKKLEFKKFFIASIWRQALAASIAVGMAFSGFGPWALVAQNLLGTIANVFALYYLEPWHPRMRFSWERFKGLFSFAWKKQAAGLIGTFCFQLKGYLIGYRYTTADLAFLNRGDGLPDMFMNNVNGTINGVLFPALSQVNDNPAIIKRGIRRSMVTSSYVLCPLLFGLAATSNQIVPILYGPNWLPAIPFMQVACLTCCMTVLNTANLQALLAIGRSDEVLKLEFYKKPVMIAILFGAIYISPLAISIGLFIYSIYVLLMNVQPNKKHLGYSFYEQVNDVKANFLLSAAMALLVYGVGYFIPNMYIALVIQIIIGVAFYICTSHLLKLKQYIYVKDTVTDIYKKKFKKKR